MRLVSHIAIACTALALAAALPACQARQGDARELPASSGGVRVSEIAHGLEHPWAVALLPDGTYLVTERGGSLRRVAANGTISKPLRGLPPVWAEGQGGLLDVVVAPDFASSHRIYFS